MTQTHERELAKTSADEVITFSPPPLNQKQLQALRVKYFPSEPHPSAGAIVADLAARLSLCCTLRDTLEAKLVEEQEGRSWGDAMTHAFQLAADEVAHVHTEVANDFLKLFTP